jgi:ABC-type nitrate/sulfonate/bicarbonate transport system permease component
MSVPDPSASVPDPRVGDLPGIDPRNTDIDGSQITQGDLATPSGRWWSFLVSDRAAVWTARILALLLWQFAGSRIDRIPTPIQVFDFLYDHRDLLWPNIWVTLQTALVALSIIVVLGTLIGFAMGRWWQVRYLLSDLVMVLIALPAFIWALLAVMWWAFDDIGPIFVACISATPMLIINTRQGAQAVDGDLQKMSSAYRVPVLRQFRQLVLPTMSEYIIAGFRFAALAAWGAILLVEFFGSEEGIGFQAAFWYDAGSFTGMMAWGFVMLVVIVAIDKLVLEPALRWTRRWRAEAKAWTM